MHVSVHYYLVSTVLLCLVLLGTPFMVRLHEQLKFFVNEKISSDPAWRGLRIYLSGHEVSDLRFLFPQILIPTASIQAKIDI